MYTKMSAYLYDYWQPPQNAQELAFFQHYVNAAGRSLELGCGTGRLLLPLAIQGARIEGVDSSDEMLARCKIKMGEQQCEVPLYHQKIEALNLGKKYALIFSALETFQQIADRADAYTALCNIYKHLEIGGSFVVYLSIPWLYMPENASEWRLINEVELDEQQYRLYEKSVHDPCEQVIYHSYRIERNGIGIEEYECPIRWYSRYEFQDLLAAVGFSAIQVQSGYTGDGPYDVMIFSAKK